MQMEKEELLPIINTCTRDSMKMARDTVMESTHCLMVKNTKANGRIIINMVKEKYYLLTEEEEKEHSKMAKKRESASIPT